MTEGQALQNPDGSPFLLFDLPKTQMIFVEKGTFNIGDNNSGRYDEKEATIQFEQGYYMGQYAVTQELYEKVMGQNPCEFKGKHRPVEQVSWYDICVEETCFLTKLNAQIKEKYPWLQGQFILPSEAQWEYAARGGQVWNSPKLDYAGSQNIKDVAWYTENTKDTATMPVGLKQPNALGLYDISGNVWEWCADYYQEDYQKIPKNGSPHLEKSSPNRILRCGSYFNDAGGCRVARRLNGNPVIRSNNKGFRLAFHSSP